MAQTPVLVILAGGANTRFWPLREKSLYHFMGETLFEKQLKVYAAVGYHEAIIVANPDNRDLIAQTLAEAHLPIAYDIVVQTQPIGMGNALLQTREKLAAKDYPPIYVCQVNDVVESTLHQKMIEAYQTQSARSYLAGYRVQKYFPGGYLSIQGDGQIVGIIEKPGAGNEPSDLVNIVAHIHTDTHTLLDKIQALYDGGHPRDDHYEAAMAQMMEETRFACVSYDGAWHPIKYPWHVLDVTHFYLSQIKEQKISPDAKIYGNAQISGNVQIEAGAKVFGGASIVGPAYIGANAIIGNGALVRESMVGAGSIIGHVSEIARSYLGRNIKAHRAVILDSVFEEDINFSAGCITANWRIDQGNVKSTVKGERIDTGREKLGVIVGAGAFIGIQSGTMPGVKIGTRGEVGAFTNLTSDLLDDERIYSVQEVRRVPATGKAKKEG
jgi:bifunctional UDP-N-acetylglucosamine pyrophosphorylase/glucosamine-1-phosphate N-acetyltransferase